MHVLRLNPEPGLIPLRVPYTPRRVPPYRFRQDRVRTPLFARRTVLRHRNVLYSPERAAAWRREQGREA